MTPLIIISVEEHDLLLLKFIPDILVHNASINDRVALLLNPIQNMVEGFSIVVCKELNILRRRQVWLSRIYSGYEGDIIIGEIAKMLREFENQEEEF